MKALFSDVLQVSKCDTLPWYWYLLTNWANNENKIAFLKKTKIFENGKAKPNALKESVLIYPISSQILQSSHIWCILALTPIPQSLCLTLQVLVVYLGGWQGDAWEHLRSLQVPLTGAPSSQQAAEWQGGQLRGSEWQLTSLLRCMWRKQLSLPLLLLHKADCTCWQVKHCTGRHRLLENTQQTQCWTKGNTMQYKSACVCNAHKDM